MTATFKPHWHSITPECRQALALLRQHSFMREFYLAGGTALALQIGHRVSKDLDWFSATNRLTSVEREPIRHTLSTHPDFVVVDERDTMLFARLLSAEVSFIYQHHPLLEPTIDLAGLALASLIDIGLMKLAAIRDRGTRRDFVDIYCLRTSVTLKQLIDLAETKYSDRPDFLFGLARALAYFDDAEQQPMPTMHKRVRWPAVRHYAEEGARYIVQRQRGKAK